MTDAPRLQILLSTLCACTLLCLSACGEKPVVGTAGTQAVAGGIAFDVGPYDVLYPELNEGTQTYQYAQSVMMIPITLTNTTKKPVSYSPTHQTASMSEATTPLLYPDPGAEVDLPPQSKVAVPGVILKEGTMPGQLTTPQSIAPGASIKDVLLFQVPPKVSSLVLSLPPSFHNGTTPVLFRLPYTPKTPKGPEVSPHGEDITLGDVTLNVSGAVSEYVATNDTANGEGFSSEPLLKVSFTLKNNSDAALLYNPNHNETAGAISPKLYSEQEGVLSRISFGASTAPKGQQVAKINIKPGESISDFTVFERPVKEVDSVLLEFPGAVVEQSGLARIKLPINMAKPEMPAKLKKKLGVKDAKKTPVPKTDEKTPEKGK